VDFLIIVCVMLMRVCGFFDNCVCDDHESVGTCIWRAGRCLSKSIHRSHCPSDCNAHAPDFDDRVVCDDDE